MDLSLLARLRIAPAPTEATNLAHLRAGLAELARAGIVACQDAAADEEDVAAYRARAESGELTARVNLALLLPEGMTEAEEAERIAWIRATRAAVQSPRLAARSVKLFLDGVIEGGTAALLEPQPDADILRFWLALLGCFDVVFVTLALWTFEALMTD